MKRYLIIILVLALAGMTVFPTAAADDCPAAKVYVTPTALHAEGITANQSAALNDAFSIGLRNANPGIEIISARDVGALLTFERDKILLGADSGGAQAFESIARSTRAEYIATLTISGVGSRYVVASSLMDADLFTVVARSTTEAASAGGLPDAITDQVAALGDLAALIEAHENANPAPPRNPSLSVTVQPESVTAEDIRDTTTITVTVKNCKGEPVPGTKVYFESRTARGQVTAEGGESNDAAYYGWQVSTTGADGTARATYQLDAARGVGAGSDRVTVVTTGRGRQEVRSKANIQITGVILEAWPKDAQVAPRGPTDIYLSLFELGPDGEKRPLADRTLYVEKFRLSGDVKVSVAGPVDGDGNPVTGADGTAVLKFVAGEKEGLEKIRILYQDVGTGYQDAIESWVEIAVKKDEYHLTIDWNEQGTWSWMATESSGTIKEKELADYAFALDARTTWDKSSGKEKTDVSLLYTDTGTYIRHGIEAVTNKWESHYSGSVKQAPTINSVIRERLGSLSVTLSPFPVEIPVTGHSSLEVKSPDGGGWNTYSSGSRSLEVLGPQPATDIPIRMITLPARPTDSAGQTEWYRLKALRDIEALHDVRFSQFIDPNLPDTALLQKTGKNVYTQDWTYADEYYWQGPYVFFGLLINNGDTVTVEGSYTRDVTIKAVKL